MVQLMLGESYVKPELSALMRDANLLRNPGVYASLRRDINRLEIDALLRRDIRLIRDLVSERLMLPYEFDCDLHPSVRMQEELSLVGRLRNAQDASEYQKIIDEYKREIIRQHEESVKFWHEDYRWDWNEDGEFVDTDKIEI